ncbi:UPF0488 protein C8orf33 homolog [Lingula anatina]|uniref:UPF0488 protein C8orf33 homolog n=1 Tax=Lingula anatina TaxID=7574 RepID=A0A1S3JJH6_LINAN|nr:UPF0488 protein C8orf33 homolog [Lingula anatina]|eukprot:XP_013410528.1 UPF0488 protein C8orf33 homolog [Lingula anatina]
MADRGKPPRPKSGNKKRPPRQKRKNEGSSDAGGDTGSNTNPDTPDNGLSPEESLERELVWCIQQLEAGLASQKSDSKQVQDSLKILKTLKNPKAPLVKKRQMMRMTFGDYRKKMQEEEKRFAASAKKICLKPAPQKHSQKSSTFLRKSQHVSSQGQTNDSQNSNTSCGSIMSNTGSGFTFSFQLNSDKGDSSEKSAVGGVITENGREPVVTAVDSNASVNYYRMMPSGQNFTFNFSAGKTENNSDLIVDTKVKPTGSDRRIDKASTKGSSEISHQGGRQQGETESNATGAVQHSTTDPLSVVTDENSAKFAAMEISESS